MRQSNIQSGDDARLTMNIKHDALGHLGVSCAVNFHSWPGLIVLLSSVICRGLSLLCCTVKSSCRA